jgi:hypothetical protein
MTRLRRRRGFLLAQMLMMLPLAALLLFVLGKMTVEALRVQHLAAEHANIVAVGEDLLRQLRADARAALACSASGEGFVLDTCGPSGPQRVSYDFTPDQVRRSGAAGDERTWTRWRLSFGWRIEHGPRGDLLSVELRETPPAHVTIVLPRTFTATCLLPPASGRPEVTP